MKRPNRSAPRPRGRLNISWNLWLLIIQPRRALERFLEYNILFLAFGLVALGGLVQGTGLALHLDTLTPILVRLFGGQRIEPMLIATGAMAAFLAAWLALAALNWAFARLIGLQAQLPRLLAALGLASLPWVFEFIVLPVTLVETSATFGGVDSVVKLLTLPWAVVLYWVALRVGSGATRGQTMAVLLLTCYTAFFVLQVALAVVAIRLGASFMGRFF